MSTGEVDNADQLLIRYYGLKSANEISELTGIDAMAIAKRTEEALGRRDPLGEAARIQILMGKLESMADEIQQRLPEMSDRNVSAAVNAAAGAMGRVLGQLTKIQTASKVDVNAITANQGKVLAELVNISMQHLRDTLKEMYPQTDDDEMDVIVQDGIRLAVTALESRVD